MKRILAILAFVALTFSWAMAQRLPEGIARPQNYNVTFTPDLQNAKFEGDETITIQVLKPTSEITAARRHRENTHHLHRHSQQRDAWTLSGQG
jgi:hypothetical protein